MEGRGMSDGIELSKDDLNVLAWVQDALNKHTRFEYTQEESAAFCIRLAKLILADDETDLYLKVTLAGQSIIEDRLNGG
jgi:hypothetical protein